jgi:hypothetical protein
LLLEKAWRTLRGGGPEGLPAVCGALAMIAVAAGATENRKLARRAHRLARRFGKVQTIDRHRRLLSRVHTLGLLSPEAAATLDARWEERLRERLERSIRRTHGRPMRKLRRALSRRARGGKQELARALEKARRRAIRGLGAEGSAAGDRNLRRIRAGLGRIQDLSRALSEAAGREPAERLAGGGAPSSDALDRWNDMSAFRRLLESERSDSEDRGAVTLALELDRLISALDASIASARREAAKTVRAASNVVAFQRRASA